MAETTEALDSARELALRRQYESCRPQLEGLGSKICLACESVLKVNSVPYHSVKMRVKALSSTLEKIIRKHYESMEQVEDLVGVRVICLYPRHIDPILKLLEAEFEVRNKSDKRPGSDPTHFGYSSVHLVCVLGRKLRSKLPEYSGIEDTAFEIQVRTILQEAWAEIEHQLVYKSDVAAPNQIKRLITRVSGSLEIADEQFQQIYDRRQEYVQELRRSELGRLEEEPLNLDSVQEFVRRQFAHGEEWLQSAGETASKELSEVLSELELLGVTTVGQLLSIARKWNEQATRESERVFRVASKQEKPQPENPLYTDLSAAEDRKAWQERLQRYYSPVGDFRVMAKLEFPDYKKPVQNASQG